MGSTILLILLIKMIKQLLPLQIFTRPSQDR